ncbi:MAG: alginate export family protein [Planctomycetota bacterium]
MPTCIAAQEQTTREATALSGETAIEEVLPETGPLRTRDDDQPSSGLLERLLPLDAQRVRIKGELREQYESWRGREFGLIPDTNNDYLLQRLYLGFELRVNEWLSTQLELGSSFQFGSPFEPAPIDEDPLYVQQLFAEVNLLETPQGKISSLIGRQTFSLGSGRLVATRNGPNIRRSFDAARLRFENDRVESQLLFGADASFGGDAFDNEIRGDRLLWGHYHTWKSGPNSVMPGNGGLDIYYLGYRNADAAFDTVSGEERRHSFGLRGFGLFGPDNTWDYNVESVFQVGSIAEQDIFAWTIASLLGRTFPDAFLSPRLGMKFDAISGDKSPLDEQLGTFNAYFPNNSYFSEAAIFAPANLLDLNLNLELQLSDRLSTVILWDFLWRYSTADAIYVPPGVPSIEGNSSDARYIGNTLSIATEWRPRPSIESAVAYVHLDAGSAVTGAGGSDADFVLLWATWFF